MSRVTASYSFQSSYVVTFFSGAIQSRSIAGHQASGETATMPPVNDSATEGAMKILYIWLFLLTTPWMFAQAVGDGVLEGAVTFGDWVVWGQVDLPAGKYTLTLEYAHAPVKVKVKSDHGKTSVLIPVSILAGTESGQNRVCLIRAKDHWHVRSVDLPQLGISLRFLPGNQPPEDARSNCVAIAMSSRSGN